MNIDNLFYFLTKRGEFCLDNCKRKYGILNLVVYGCGKGGQETKVFFLFLFTLIELLTLQKYSMSFCLFVCLFLEWLLVPQL